MTFNSLSCICEDWSPSDFVVETAKAGVVLLLLLQFLSTLCVGHPLVEIESLFSEEGLYPRKLIYQSDLLDSANEKYKMNFGCCLVIY